MKISGSQFKWVVDAYFFGGARVFRVGPVLIGWRKTVADPPGWEPPVPAPTSRGADT